uniref:Uncharacterized protein n=1 Tax=Rhizophora mucronata TaxID=61149 RepID=A0A2P2N242_RHIMU
MKTSYESFALDLTQNDLMCTGKGCFKVKFSYIASSQLIIYQFFEIVDIDKKI